MKQRILVFTTCVLVIFLAGCGQQCFYQAGTSIEQCERDLRECFFSVNATYLCMQERGYEYLDTDKLPHKTKWKKVVLVRSEEYTNSDYRRGMSIEYWIADGRGKAPRLIEYRVQRGPAGNFILTLVYEDKKKQ